MSEEYDPGPEVDDEGGMTECGPQNEPEILVPSRNGTCMDSEDGRCYVDRECFCGDCETCHAWEE